MKYLVHGAVTISVATVVEAGSAAEALEKAQDSQPKQLCYRCSRLEEDEWTTDELDGTVEILRAEEYVDHD
jgi:hypothetical protein